MAALLIVMLAYTPEAGPWLLQTYWPLAVCEMAAEAGAVRLLGRRGVR